MGFVITEDTSTPASRLAAQTDHALTVTLSDTTLQSLIAAVAAIRDRAVGSDPRDVTVVLSADTLTVSWTSA